MVSVFVCLVLGVLFAWQVTLLKGARLERTSFDVAFHEIKLHHLATATHRITTVDWSITTQGFVATFQRQVSGISTAVAPEFARKDHGVGDLFHHPVGHFAEALLANGTGDQAFLFARTAHHVTLATLGDRRRRPVVADRALEEAQQCLVVDQSFVAGRRCPRRRRRRGHRH